MASSLFWGLYCLLWVACGAGKQQDLDRAIKKALRDTPGVEAAEFAKIRDVIKGDEGLSMAYPSDSLIVVHIQSIAEEMGHAKRNPIALPVAIETGGKTAADIPSATELHFFYENSASMDGYLNGNTNFTDAVLGLLARSDLNNDKINLYYINREAYPVDSMIGEFVDFLKPSNVKNVGKQGRGNSEINRILGIVSDTIMRNKDRIGVVISDYIYSINGRDISKQLNFQKNTTITNLKALGNGDYALLIIKITSMFDGIYYDMLGKKPKIREERPVFIWVIGQKDKILAFPERYRIREFKGYKTHLVLLKEGNGNLPYYSVLKETCKEGHFEKAERSANPIVSISDIDCNRNDVFQFGVAIDLSKCPTDADYLMDTAFYKVITDSGDAFTVTNVLPIDNIEHNDKQYKGSATHIIQIRAGKLSKGAQTIRLQLIKGIPTWVDDCSTECDTTARLRQGKTFGFNYLVDGAKTVFDYTHNSCYFSLPITIKR